MRLLKKINNNFAIALDSKGEQIIVEGKGIGFNKMPCDLNDLSQVSHTYYNAKIQDITLIQYVSEDLMELCGKIFDFAIKTVGERVNPNLTFTLADHIQFCIERNEKNIEMKIPLYYDIEYLYPKESKVAEYALKLIFDELHIMLPDTEKTGIAMNIINSELQQEEDYSNNDELVELCTSVIEKSMDMKIDRNSFSYSRFVTHLHYLFRRVTEGKQVSPENMKLFKTISIDYPEVRKCVDIMENVLRKKNFIMNDEEKIYLMMHVNRLCTRVDCNH